MTRVKAGFDTSNTMVAEVTLPRARYSPAAKVFQFELDFDARLHALPGVTHASGVYPLPMSGDGWGATLGVEGQPEVPGQPEPHAEFGIALPDYFQTVRIPLIEGRDFVMADDVSATPVAVVDEVLARKYWPGQSAVGKRIGFGGVPQKETGWLTVIGVVGHVRNAGPRQEGEPQVYMSALQNGQSSLYYLARTDGDAMPLAQAMRASLRSLDAALPIAKLEAMTAVVARATARERFNVLLLTVFGVIALALAAGGLYGMMSYLVTEQSREIGIRLALGGGPGRVVRRIVGEGVVVTVVGVFFGCGLALWLSRAVADLLFVIKPTDPLTYASIATLLVIVAALASYVPARRAVQVDPVTVLRG
jgi:predicted permease